MIANRRQWTVDGEGRRSDPRFKKTKGIAVRESKEGFKKKDGVPAKDGGENRTTMEGTNSEIDREGKKNRRQTERRSGIAAQERQSLKNRRGAKAKCGTRATKELANIKKTLSERPLIERRGERNRHGLKWRGREEKGTEPNA